VPYKSTNLLLVTDNELINVELMPPKSTYNIIIADDQLMVAEGLSALLEQHDDFNVIAIAENGEKLIHLLNQQQPHLVLLDLNMPVMDGFKACLIVREKFPEIVVIALTTYDDEKIRQRIKSAGAAGMLLKYTSSHELANNIRNIMKHGNKGEFVADKSPQVSLNNEHISDADNFMLQNKISGREMEIIQLIAEGLNSEEIAKKLFLSEHTVKTHRKNILEKLNLKNTAELISFIHKHKLL
jgi:DNA-binding NarL/FixJ family response regulator